ncbi:MAG: flippase-like domain-containing protein [Acidobacteria bacterium]|nr:flippase-like domain-containing protein [Acidobacteriota bacterium]
MRGSLRKFIYVLLVLLILGALFYRARGVIHLEGFSWERLSHTMRQARGGPLLVSLVAIYVGYALRALRWVRFCRYLGRPSFGSVYRSTIIGFTALLLLGRAGEPIRPLLIARKDRLSVSSMFGIYVLERIFDGASTAVLAGIGLLVISRGVSAGIARSALVTAARTAGILLFAGLFAAVVFLVYFRLRGAAVIERGLVGWRAAGGWKRRFAGLFAGFSEGLQAIRTWPDLLVAVGYSAGHWFVIALVYVWVPQSFGGQLAEIDFRGAMLVLAFTMVGSTLQLPAVGGGSQAASFLAFTVVFGVEQEPAAAASIVLWLITFAAPSLVGVPLLIREGWSMAELRRLAREEAEAEAAGTHADVPDVPRAGRGKLAKPGGGLP